MFLHVIDGISKFKGLLPYTNDYMHYSYSTILTSYLPNLELYDIHLSFIKLQLKYYILLLYSPGQIKQIKKH